MEPLSKALSESPQGLDDSEYLRKTITECVEHSDYVAAFDLLERARQAVNRKEPIARASVGSSEHLVQFLNQADRYRDYLGQPRMLRQLTGSIEKGATILGIPFGQLDDARRQDSIRILKLWSELARYPRLDDPRNRPATAVESVCRFVGFPVAEDKCHTGPSREGLAHFRLPLVFSPTVSPLPLFGSSLDSKLDVVVSQRRYEPEQITAFIEHEDIRHKAVLVLLMDPVSANYRLKWQRECSRSHSMALPLDHCLLLHLCGIRNRLPALLDIGLPFMWARPYITKGETVAPEMFVGRRSEIDSIADPVGGCIVYGGRPIRKVRVVVTSPS